jgi:hypothetical protein
MSTTAPRDHVDLATTLAESHALKAQSEHDRFLAEISLPPVNAAGSGGTQPDGGTDDQRSQWKRYLHDRPGSEQRSDHGVNQA